MILIKELEFYNQTITAVIDDSKEPPFILSLRKGPMSRHEASVADFHSERLNTIIKVEKI